MNKGRAGWGGGGREEPKKEGSAVPDDAVDGAVEDVDVSEPGGSSGGGEVGLRGTANTGEILNPMSRRSQMGTAPGAVPAGGAKEGAVEPPSAGAGGSEADGGRCSAPSTPGPGPRPVPRCRLVTAAGGEAMDVLAGTAPNPPGTINDNPAPTRTKDSPNCPVEPPREEAAAEAAAEEPEVPAPTMGGCAKRALRAAERPPEGEGERDMAKAAKVTARDGEEDNEQEGRRKFSWGEPESPWRRAPQSLSRQPKIPRRGSLFGVRGGL